MAASKLSPEQLAEIESLLESNTPHGVIAEKFGVSQQAISYRAKKLEASHKQNGPSTNISTNTEPFVQTTNTCLSPQTQTVSESISPTNNKQQTATNSDPTNTQTVSTNKTPPADTLTIGQVTIPRDMYVWLRTFHDEKTWEPHLWSPAGADDLARLTAEYNRQIEDGEWVVRRPKAKPSPVMAKFMQTEVC